METDKEQDEVDLAQGLIEHPPGELRPPEVETREHRKDDGAEDDVVEVGHHEVGVGEAEVEGRAGQDDAGEATEEEGHQEAERPDQRR